MARFLPRQSRRFPVVLNLIVRREGEIIGNSEEENLGRGWWAVIVGEDGVFRGQPNSSERFDQSVSVGTLAVGKNISPPGQRKAVILRLQLTNDLQDLNCVLEFLGQI